MSNGTATDIPRVVDIDVGYDETSKLYFVLTSGLPGLHVETSTFEGLIEIVLDAAPDLLGATHERTRLNFRRTVDLMPANGR